MTSHSIDFEAESYDTFVSMLGFLCEREFVVRLRGETVQLTRIDFDRSTGEDNLIFTSYNDGERNGPERRLPAHTIRQVVVV